MPHADVDNQPDAYALRLMVFDGQLVHFVHVGRFDPSIAFVDAHVALGFRLSAGPLDFDDIDSRRIAKTDVDQSLVGTIVSITNTDGRGPRFVSTLDPHDRANGISFGDRTYDFQLHEMMRFGWRLIFQ